MRTMKSATATAIVALSASFVATGEARAADYPPPTNFLYGGGSTLASAVMRELMDYWNFPLRLPIDDSGGGGCSPNQGLPPTGAPNYGFYPNDVAQRDFSLGQASIFYAAVGSTPGKTAFINHNGGSVAAGLGTASPMLPPPYTFGSSCTTSPAWTTLNGTGGYPFVHFAVSDDPINPDDMAAYNAAGGPAKYGKLIQIPAFVTTIAIAFNPTGLNVSNTGSYGSESLKLTRKQVCGIFSGHITDWADPIFSTSGTNGSPITTTSIPLTVVHFQELSGETFLLTNALKEQCAGIVGPNNAYHGDLTNSLWEIGWSDRAVGAAACPALQTTKGSDLVNWPDYGTDQCGGVIANAGGGTFVSATHDDQVACTIALNPGDIGYVSPDFEFSFARFNGTISSCPGNPNYPPAAALQNQYSVDNDPPEKPSYFAAPAAVGMTFAMQSAVPDFPTDAALTNPLSWSTQSLVRNPQGYYDYPIVGFVWIDLYQCYNQSTAAGNVLGTLEGFLQFLYGGYVTSSLGPGDAKTVLYNNDFFYVPTAWSNALTQLALSSSARLGVGGQGVCSGIPGG